MFLTVLSLSGIPLVCRWRARCAMGMPLVCHRYTRYAMGMPWVCHWYARYALGRPLVCPAGVCPGYAIGYAGGMQRVCRGHKVNFI